MLIIYDGLVYGKHLGKKIAEMSASMTAFDPNQSRRELDEAIIMGKGYICIP
jgi:hypothetical protein